MCNGTPNAYAAGVGASLGYIPSIPIQPYVGLTFVHHWGTTEAAPPYETTWNIRYLGVEFGKELDFGFLALTPYASIGQADAQGETCLDGADCDVFTEGGKSTYVAPCLRLVVPAGPVAFGIDARMLFVSDGIRAGDAEQGASGVVVYGAAGARF